MDIVCRTSVNQSSSIQINSIVIPVPPISVLPCDYLKWFDENFKVWLNNNAGTENSGVNDEWMKQVHLKK